MYWNWTEEDEEFAQQLIAGEFKPVDPLELAPSVKATLSKDQAIGIVGEETVKRYWRDDLASHSAFILEDGSQNWGRIYRELEDKGWKGRSVSLLKAIVDHYRSAPLAPAVDEIAVEPPALPSTSLLRRGEMDGRIGAIKDKSGDLVMLTIAFPYDDHFVFVVKRIYGRRWNSSKKYWEIPIESAKKAFELFPYFELSEGAKRIKEGL